MKPKKIRARLAVIHAEFRSINDSAADRSLNADEETRWAALVQEQEQLETTLTEAEETERRASQVAEHRARWQSVQVGDIVPTDDNTDLRSLGRTELRDRARKRADDAGELVGINPESRARLDVLIRSTASGADGAVVAERLLLTENDDYRSAFAKAMFSPTPAWTPDEAAAVARFRAFESRAMSEGSTTSGGFGIPVMIDPSIILTNQQSLNPFRRISRTITLTNTNIWKGVSSAGVSWSYDAEAAEVSDDTPTLAQPSIQVETARGFVPFSVELGQDYPDFGAELAVLLAEGKDELEAQKFAVGAGHGSTEPLGIVTALDADTNVEVVVTTDGALGTVDITKVWKALPDRAKANATWVMGAGTASDIAALGDAYGTRTSDLTGNLEKLRTRPVEASSYVPDFAGVTTAQNLLVVGDFRKFAIVERAGMSLELVPHLLGTTNNRPTGQRGWFAWARNSSGPTDIRAFRLLQNQ